MKKLVYTLFGAAALCSSAWGALDVGEKAPDFTAPAAMSGKQFDFSLEAALAKGPVVLYFFPAAFSAGCSAEAHAFADATEQFKALGATVIGVSSDDIETELKFSTQACQGKFPVASDSDKKVIKAYDAAMMLLPDYANRVSYVIAPNHAIVYSYQSLNPDKHVANTLAALRDWDSAQKKQ